MKTFVLALCLSVTMLGGAIAREARPSGEAAAVVARAEQLLTASASNDRAASSALGGSEALLARMAQ